MTISSPDRYHFLTKRALNLYYSRRAKPHPNRRTERPLQPCAQAHVRWAESSQPYTAGCPTGPRSPNPLARKEYHLAADVTAKYFTPRLKHREHADAPSSTPRAGYERDGGRFWWAAVGIGVLVAFVSAVVGLTGRGAFFDEGVYLLVGRLLVSQGQNWHFETWLVGSPWAFPLVAGLIERFGGSLREVRLFNSVALGISTVGVVWFAHLLRFNRDSLTALVSGLIFGLTGVCLFTGSFATYDADLRDKRSTIQLDTDPRHHHEIRVGKGCRMWWLALPPFPAPSRVRERTPAASVSL